MLQPAKTALELLRSLPEGRLKDKIFFVHLPKCGGTSIARAIRNAYGFSGRLSERSFAISPRSTHRAAELTGIPAHRYRELMLLYAMGHPRYQFVEGHVQYSPTAFAAFGDWNLVIVFREPVSKWISEYFYNRYKESEHARTDEDLIPFLDTESASAYGNDYVRYLSSDKERSEWGSAEAIDDAIENLGNFEVIGVLEEMQRFVADFRGRFGVKLRIEVHNSSPVSRQSRDSQVTPEIRQRIEDLCRPNLAVYRHVRERLARTA